MAIDYKSAGVDVERGYEAVRLMKKYVKETYTDGVLGDLGSFGGFYALDDKPDGDVLVAGTDGVGTKLKYAFVLDRHDTVGIDCVAMCVNDIVCQGAKPLIFLDYIALSRLVPQKVAYDCQGSKRGVQAGGLRSYRRRDSRNAGLLRRRRLRHGGVRGGRRQEKQNHQRQRNKRGRQTCGFEVQRSAQQRLFSCEKAFPSRKRGFGRVRRGAWRVPAQALLRPTRIYVKTILSLIEKHPIKGIAHITGGGFIENIPRILPEGLAAKIDRSSYEIPALFKALQRRSGISDEKMYNTFNMGIGMVLCLDGAEEEKALETLRSLNEEPVRLGEVVRGRGVIL